LALLLAAGPLPAPLSAQAPDRHALNRAINEQVRGALRSSPTLGIEVEEVASGERIYGYRADELRIIASNTKLFTSAAALHYLGPGYTFETPLLTRGPVVAGTLRGDLAVVGRGDPTLSERFTLDPYSAFRTWAHALAERGIRRVEGDLYLVHGYFEDAQVHPDWPRDQLANWYEAPVSALSFNDNCVWVRVSPTGGGRARVDVLPPLGRYPVVNLTRTGPSSRYHQVVVTRKGDASEIEVRGYVWHGARPVDAWVSVPDPVEYFGAALTAAFEEEGIEVAGHSRPVERIPAGAWERVAAHRTNLLTVLQVILERSQNFYAESLLKTLGAERCGGGTWEAGLEAVAQFLDEEVGIPPGAYRMADGSGMSRGNRFSPDQTVRLLRYMYYHPWGRAFLQSLPYSGEEGLAWERRLAGDGYRGNVFAKTGTLTGVSTLSGYVKGRSGTLYAFSILGNGTGSTWRARDAQDRILKAIIDNG
jgi:D-alanyl-D-alanine carboxypeptidase/D-alanyl-D-alanine-endopeptidase (penicillin-binding protein 4)